MKGIYACTNCTNVELREREVYCWECGKGEMVWHESDRHKIWELLTGNLPSLPTNNETPWLWSDKEIDMLRAACAKRFDEKISTESLMCIAATGIRIYLNKMNNPDEQPQ